MVKIIQKLVPESKYSIKCPNIITPKGITVHNTANDASALNEIAYMTNNNYEISYHYAVDDIQAVQGLPLNRNGWHASDGTGPGNMTTIAIEICYSLSGGARFDKAEENAAELIAQLLKQYGWGIDRVKRHYDYAPNKKYCPHRTMDKGWNRFLNMIQSKMGQNPSSTTNKLIITYQTWDDIYNKWLPNVENDNDYAGIYKHDVCCVYANANIGNVYYKVSHVNYKQNSEGKWVYSNSRWLPEVKNRTDYAGLYNKPIDGFMIKSDTKPLTYRVHLRNKNRWLPWVTGYSTSDSNNGYAGIIGQEIDAIQIKVKE